jgi:rod shape-determining protein MreC
MLVLASITVLTLNYHGEANRIVGHVRNGVADALSPFQRGLAATMHPFGDAASAIFHYGELQSDNARLRSQVGALSMQLAESKYAANLERQISVLSNLPFAANIPTLPAEVIGQASSNLELTIELNKGTAAGVGIGMPVVADSGLIGSVISASANTSTVLLIADTRSTLEVQDQQTGHLFQLQGAGAHHFLALTPYGSSSGAILKGASLITAGQTDGSPASAYPAGLPVGDVEKVTTSTSGIFATGQVTPFVDMTGLQYVSVLLWLPPA